MSFYGNVINYFTNILEQGRVEEYSFDNLPSGVDEPGTYLHLVFKTGHGSENVYINVKSLNEVAGQDTEAIQVMVDASQAITADLTENLKKYLYGDIQNNIPENTVPEQIARAKEEAINNAKGVIFTDDGEGNLTIAYHSNVKGE